VEHFLLKFVRLGTLVVWGLILVGIAHQVSAHAGPDSSFLARHLFVLAMISWIAGLVLSVRLQMRRHGERKRSFFG
jgi:hypothetical protein